MIGKQKFFIDHNSGVTEVVLHFVCLAIAVVYIFALSLALFSGILDVPLNRRSPPIGKWRYVLFTYDAGYYFERWMEDK